MVGQYDLSQAQIKHAPLFSPRDLHHILHNNLGLRLTHRSDEITQGGYGDTIPLAHLGGAKESIKFATLSALLLRNPELDPSIQQQHRQALTGIFETFAGHDHADYHYVPVLILVYASLLNITSIQIDPKFFERRLPKDEEAFLIDIYQKSDYALHPRFIFDNTSHYYAELPSLRLHLTTDFNQLLARRLDINLNFYCNQIMHYLLITNPYPRFDTAIDLSHYALGKTGKATFAAEDIVSNITIDTNDTSAIWTWLKQKACTFELKPVIAPSKEVPSYTQPVVTPSEKTPSYAQQCVTYCQENKLYMAGLLTAGLFAGYKLWQGTQAHTDDPTAQSGPGF